MQYRRRILKVEPLTLVPIIEKEKPKRKAKRSKTQNKAVNLQQISNELADENVVQPVGLFAPVILGPANNRQVDNNSFI